jgi:hypothetical protein
MKAAILVSVLVLLLGFMTVLLIYKKYASGFTDKEKKISEISNYFGEKLTFKKLKNRCPECTNVDYYRAKKFI